MGHVYVLKLGKLKAELQFGWVRGRASGP